MVRPCGDGNDVLPVVDFALPLAGVASGEDMPGYAHTHDVVAPRVYDDDLFPSLDIARTRHWGSDGGNSSVGSESNRMQVSGSDAGEVLPALFT